MVLAAKFYQSCLGPQGPTAGFIHFSPAESKWFILEINVLVVVVVVVVVIALVLQPLILCLCLCVLFARPAPPGLVS